jgi:diguanylate cyclase (GGDEF)-like protein
MQAPSVSILATRRLVISAVVFLLAVGVTLLAWHLMQLSIRNSAARAFEEHALRIEQSILERMRGYEQVLRGAGGLFAASSSINRDEWRRYVETVRIRDVYPGVRGVHFAPRVSAAELTAHIVGVQSEGFGQYSIRPEGVREEYYPVAWPEPLDERNRRVMGFDMYSEPVRRTAMQRARDSGKPAISGKVTLAGETRDPVPGFVYYYPVFARDQPIGTVEERRRAIIGFIFCPFRMPDLMDGLIGQTRDTLDVEIYDAGEASEASLLYDDDGIRRALREGARPEYWLERELKIGGHSWNMYFEASTTFLSSIDGQTPRLLLLGGLFLSAMVTLLVWRLLASEAAALAASMHDGLTGLYNRRYLEASLKREEVRAKRARNTISIVQFDLDHFKKLNDTFGHAAGDEVLRRVGEVLRGETRADDIACRYGGEEFTIIMPGASLDHAVARARTLSRKVGELKIGHAGQWLPRVTISGGVAVFPQDASTLVDVLSRADHALLRAKREGRERVLVAQQDDPTTT